MGYSAEQIERQFGHLLTAFEYGVPPHGGIAMGIDRFIALLAGEDSIREVIAFPKNQAAADLLMQAPGPVSKGQLGRGTHRGPLTGGREEAVIRWPPSGQWSAPGH